MQASGCSRRSFRVKSPTVPFAFPMLRCTAPDRVNSIHHRYYVTSMATVLSAILFSAGLSSSWLSLWRDDQTIYQSKQRCWGRPQPPPPRSPDLATVYTSQPPPWCKVTEKNLKLRVLVSIIPSLLIVTFTYCPHLTFCTKKKHKRGKSETKNRNISVYQYFLTPLLVN